MEWMDGEGSKMGTEKEMERTKLLPTDATGLWTD